MQMSIFGDLNPLKSLNDLSLNNQRESQQNFEEIRNKINFNSGYNNQQNKSLIQQLPQILKELTSQQMYDEGSPGISRKWNVNQSQYLQKQSLESTKYIQQGYKPQESIRYLSIELDYNGKNNNSSKNQKYEIFKTSDTKLNTHDQSIQNQEIEQQNMSQLMENKQKQVLLTNQQNRAYNQIQKHDQYPPNYLPIVQKISNIQNMKLKQKQNQYQFDNIQSTQKQLQDSDYFVNKMGSNIAIQFRKKQDFSSDSNSLNSNKLSQTVFMNQTAINKLVEKNIQNLQSQNNSIIRNSGIQEVIVQSYEKKKQDYYNLEKKQSKQNIDIKRIKDSQLGMAQVKVLNKKNRNQEGKLNYSMHFERGEIKKFERYLDKAFSNKQKGRNKTNAMSMDHSMLNNEILIDDFQTNHLIRNSEYERNQDTSLPQISNRQLYQSIQETGRKQVMQSMDCSTFISYKEKLNQLGKEEDKFKLIDQAAIKKNVQNNYFLQSHHYKYNRLKDGGWGKEQQISAQVSASDIIKNEIIQSKFKQNRHESNQIIGSARIFTDDMSNILSSSKQNQIQSFQEIESNRLIKMENQKPLINISKILGNHPNENKNIMYGENAEKFIKSKQLSKIQNRKNDLNQYKTSSQQHLVENETIKLPRQIFSPRMEENQPLVKKSFDKICISRNTIKTEKTIHVNKTGITPADASQEKIFKAQIDKSKIVFLKKKSIERSNLDEIETKVQNRTSDGNIINDTMNFEESSKNEDYNYYQLRKLKETNQNNVEITNESLKETSENYLTKFTNTNPRMLNINQSTFIYNQSPALSQNNQKKSEILKIPEFKMKKQIINIKKMENNDIYKNDKDKQMNMLSQHLQQQYDKQEKEEFNRIYEQNDRQMRYLQGSQIKNDYQQIQNELNEFQDSSQFIINDKNAQKKYRKQILEQIEFVKQQIKQKKLQNKKLKQLNNDQQTQFGQQIEINNRLGNLIQTLEYSQVQNEQEKDENHQNLQIIFQNNKSDQSQNNILTIQQQNEQDSVFDANQSHDSYTKKKNKSTWEIEKQKYSLLNQSSIRSQKLEQSRQNIHEFYKYLYQPDLNQAKERTEHEIFIVNSQNQIMQQELQLLKIENESLRNFIKRYNRLIKEQQDKKEFKDKDQPIENQKENEINMEYINQQLYKGHNDVKELNLGQKTQQSFLISRAPQIIDVKKIEQINLSFQKIFKQPKVIDTIVMFIQCLKSQFKTDQVCLYIIDTDLQTNLFHNYHASRNIKKIDINAGEQSTKSLQQVLAIFDKDKDFSMPLFKDLDDAGNNIFNNKAILIPVKKQKQILFSFQIIYNLNKKSIKHQKEKKHRKQKKQTQSMMEKTSQRSSSAISNSECQSPRRGNSFTGLSQFSNYKAAQKQKNVPGWNMNDYNLIKVYVNYISMNIDYYFGLTQIKSKSKTMFDIIDFSLDIMDVKTFRQLVRKVQQYKETIFGFKEVSLFFLNEKTNELFTLTNIEVADKVKRETEFDTSFARELIFPDESVVIIPSTIGMSGEVHRKMGMQYGNNFGQIGKKEEEQIEPNDSDDQMSPMSVYSRKIYQGLGHNENKRTKLEKIIEDHPFKENDNDTIEQSHTQQEFKVNQIQDNIKIESPLPQSYLKEYDFTPDINQNPNQSPIGNIFQELIDSDSPINQKSPSIHKRSQIYNEPKSPKKSFQAVVKGKQQLRLSKIENYQKQPVQKEKYYSQFLADVDNFIGVKDLKNYLIISLKDNGMNLGEKSVGILQLFNKLEDKSISQSDIARIEQISRLVGALAIKTQTYTQCLTLIIGMEGLNQKTSVANNLSKKITEYIQPGLGLFEKLEVPIDFLMQYKLDS